MGYYDVARQIISGMPWKSTQDVSLKRYLRVMRKNFKNCEHKKVAKLLSIENIKNSDFINTFIDI